MSPVTPVVRTRAETLDLAALQLLTGDTSHPGGLRALRDLLSPLAADPAEPAWVRDALATAVSLLQAAEAGGDAGSALARVGALLELVSADAAQGEAGTTSPEGCVMPAESVRELLPQFVAESLDCLEQAESALLELESNPGASEAVNVVFRAFHTIKSTAAFFGLEPISRLAHTVESVLCRVRDGQAAFTRQLADLSLGSADMMRALVRQAESVVQGGRLELELPETYDTLLARLHDAERQLANGGLQQTAPAAVAVAPPPLSRPAESWVRVRTQRLDQLVDLVGELVVAQSMIAQDPAILQDRHGVLARKVQHTSKIVRELQDLGMSLRMVPLRPLFQKMQRLVRDLARSAGKPLLLLTEGEETEIDRNMVDALSDPLVHMIRNAIDHGIESPDERAAAGKPATGTLRLSARHAGGAVIVELHDDGRGLDSARIVAAAVAKGVIESERGLSAGEIHELIFEPGLSTRAHVTTLSGRGVGMDVVRRNIEALHGRVEIGSSGGSGTCFTLRLPLTLAITEGMLVRVGNERYILPTANIHTSFRPAADALSTAAGGGEFVLLHQRVIPIVRLHHVLAVTDAATDPRQALLVVVGEEERRYALLVDELLGQQQFVAKPVADGLGHVPGIAGGAILGDGRVGLILDPPGLVAAARRLPPFAA